MFSVYTMLQQIFTPCFIQSGNYSVVTNVISIMLNNFTKVKFILKLANDLHGMLVCSLKTQGSFAFHI
jgi:hypothetical protein